MKIPEIKLQAVPITELAKKAVGYRYNDVAGTRHKLGREPDFIQHADWPVCCANEMTFYVQIDSIGDDYDLADCGMIYVFVCFSCLRTASLLQSS